MGTAVAYPSPSKRFASTDKNSKNHFISVPRSNLRYLFTKADIPWLLLIRESFSLPPQASFSQRIPFGEL
jgi:hypothetical protein